MFTSNGWMDGRMRNTYIEMSWSVKSENENTSSMYRFYSSVFSALLLRISFSTADMKMLANAIVISVPIAILCV